MAKEVVMAARQSPRVMRRVRPWRCLRLVLSQPAVVVVVP